MDVLKWLPEFQVSAETDEELQNYFLKTLEVQKIIQGRSWLVLGRKGTGKTAIFEYLKKAKPSDINNYVTIPLNFKDYPWPIHQLYKEALAGELSAYQKSWRYLFFVKAVVKLIELKKHEGQSLNNELKWAEKYINAIYGNPDPSMLEVLLSKIGRVKTISGPKIDLVDNVSFELGEVSFEEIASSKELQSKLRTNAFTLMEHFEKIFINNCAGYKFLIILDQLDENWLRDHVKEYSNALINLLNVGRSIEIDGLLKNHLKVVPFLRTDIYHDLRFNDKNKLLQDSAIVISWNQESLDDMFFERIKKYLPDQLNLDLSRKTGCIFEPTFVRQGTPVFKYISRRSFFRPRDIIVYLNKVRERHKENKSGLYTSAELYEADQDASASIYGEIIDEWTNQFPEIENLLTVLQTIEIDTFDYSDFQSKYKVIFLGSEDWRVKERLQFLFDNSIIGQKHQGRWEYVCSMPNLKMNTEKEFRTHHALKYRLHLKEKRSNQ